LVATSAL
jgi:hypothetical protein